ncbi:MAG: hypothetical protein IJS60_11080 [Abditibacteriota bacterium]|nr:hypothetical protein [Abditibacteriota bacterium]
MKYFIGIDVGGTKCETVVCNENADIVGYGIAYGSECANQSVLTDPRGRGGMGRSLECIQKSFLRATENVDLNEDIYITYNQPISYFIPFLKERKVNFNSIIHAAEPEGIFRAANLDRCYLALSGTGAFTYLCEKDDRLYFDGLGPNLGDYGSGFYIGHKAYKAAALDEWGPEFKTSIARRINKAVLGRENNHYGNDLVPYFFEMPDRNFIAEFSKIVSEEAEKGDRIAKEILVDSGRLLGRTLRCLVKNVRPRPDNLPVVCSGSVLTKCRIFKEAFIEYCREHIPENELIFCPLDSVYGHLMNSVIQEGSLNKDEFYNKLLISEHNLKK